MQAHVSELLKEIQTEQAIDARSTGKRADAHLEVREWLSFDPKIAEEVPVRSLGQRTEVACR